MHPFYREFLGYLEEGNKANALDFVLRKLSGNELDIVTLYNELLIPSLNDIVYPFEDEAMRIWYEHVRTAIIRTILENCYPYIIKEREKQKKPLGKVVVLCPTEEYHELGARMVADFFTLLGYDVTFIGANTPRNVTLAAVKHIQPDYIALSVTNFYHLSSAQRIIKALQETVKAAGKELKVIVGGDAFRRNPERYKEFGADVMIQTFEELERYLAKGGAK